MKKRDIAAIILTVLCTVALMWFWNERQHRNQEPEQLPDTTRAVSIDTLAVVNPSPVDVSVINTKVVRLPLRINPAKSKVLENSSLTVEVDSTANDSVDVVLPIEQKTYTDSISYRAVISGAFVNLDTIEVFRRTEVINITHPPSTPKHWGIGLVAGYGATPKGLQPFVGVAVTFTIFRF